jgi:hypothetical protein
LLAGILLEHLSSEEIAEAATLAYLLHWNFLGVTHGLHLCRL